MMRQITTLAVCLLLGMAQAVEYSSIQVDGKRVTLCRVSVKREHLQLYHRDEAGTAFRRFDRLAPWLQARGQKLVFAMNAGMYHGNMSAVGLVVADGKTLVPLNTAEGEGNFFLKPNGVFAITDSGARVMASSEYASLQERVILATQSGPLLVRAGKLHPAFNAGSKNLRYRNGVGIPSPDIAIFAITEEQVNLYQFATMFRDMLHCPDALYFDGDVSSLYAAELQRCDFRMDLGPILGVTE